VNTLKKRMPQLRHSPRLFPLTWYQVHCAGGSISAFVSSYNKAIQLKPSMAETYEYRGVLFAKMGKKSDAEKDLAALKKLNPKLASELAEFLKTGKEEDEYAPTSSKQKS
jgi:hypothetical protein